ncbi:MULTISPECIES: YhcG family protein [unclassified Rathayibacter]|uniref:PDDEXK nuclease domain-containing protein n=1 Tax=unclassified Rathayibacter TaxID=2609250 RepID=UPI000F4BC9C3|nr:MULTISPECIES: PDDEXK nuclease domain-containing protein [unclassified Rathayibacter]MCJ1674860.1 PDDEXK nuclease domain-containing protein [Rathayibacter sp. VKM Ac-2929]MCJ1683689.1 PDDEXK nuclease domain-containing protein [Rathayibacter sp. VKM Ac-2928]MCJ1702373.1 PDDEXK nuclease domain-containing protein [Rathayibacter sp. VKM Ac-2926]ROP56965.1 putative nuclease of restriction endonuclease-like (RecB) superfamily [Rathayibacter sp. PhB186]ROS55350.1 putative nuclease of restriction en
MTQVLPDGYAQTLELLVRRAHEARFAVQRTANTEVVALWWFIGHTLVERQRAEPWGSGVLARLAADLRAEFPTMKGFSESNLRYARRFAEAWPSEDLIRQQPVGELPWGHTIQLLDKLDDQRLRDWYAAQDVEHGWSRAVLQHQIATRLHERTGAAPSNFSSALERRDSELAQQLTKDPYALDFLAIDSDAGERELEERLTLQVVDTLRELGAGFSFVGRQVHFDVDGDDFFVDLLFFNWQQVRFVVVELKTRRFDPRDAGQLGFYVALVDDTMRIPELHAPTVGILLVTDKNETVVKYSLAGSTQAVAVSRYELSPADQATLPAEETLTRIATEVMDETRSKAP